ncbi:MAG: hypothetical protein H6Q17_2193 [Bacteroidetes bacterium]|nr:hypothetical protein [Bacteroidota bacterium]
MKKWFLMLVCGVSACVTSNSQNSCVQIGPLINYGLTTLHTSQVGTGVNITFAQKCNDLLSVYEDALLMLPGAKTEQFSNYSYGAWNAQAGVGFNVNLIRNEDEARLYTILGGTYNYTKSIFINSAQGTYTGGDESHTQGSSFYPGMVAGIGSRFNWGRNRAIALELKYNLVFNDYFDAIKASDGKHNDTFVCLCFKIELPMN